MIECEIEVAALPETVRDVLLDFPKLAEWHKGWIVSIESQTPGKATGHDMAAGDSVCVQMDGMKFYSTIQENTSTRFWWRGGGYGILVGSHGFHYAPSQKTPGGTTLRQWEDFSGLLAFYMRPGMPGGKKTLKGFEGLSADVKARAEALSQAAKR